MQVGKIGNGYCEHSQKANIQWLDFNLRLGLFNENHKTFLHTLQAETLDDTINSNSINESLLFLTFTIPYSKFISESFIRSDQVKHTSIFSLSPASTSTCINRLGIRR